MSSPLKKDQWLLMQRLLYMKSESKDAIKANDAHLYPLLPWATCKPKKGIPNVALGDLPLSLLYALAPLVQKLYRGVDECGHHSYSYVSYQSGAKKGPLYRGFVVQFQWEGRITRVGMVNDPSLGAVVAAAARLDPRLIMRTTTVSASSWLTWMAKGGDEAAAQWLAEVDMGSVRIPQQGRGGRPPTKDGAHARRVQNLLVPKVTT